MFFMSLQSRQITDKKEAPIMPKINVLPKHLAELIAAGVVVERAASVV